MRLAWQSRWLGAAVAGLGCACTWGCGHKVARAPMPVIVRAPVALLEVPRPALPALRPVAIPSLAVPTAASVDREMRRWRKRPWVRTLAAAPVPAPSVPAAVMPEPSPVEVIGQLSAGGDSTVARQQAGQLIDETDRRLVRLPPGVSRSRKTLLAQVRDFQEKARAAVRSGDAEGAMTLATKAALLLDDLLK